MENEVTPTQAFWRTFLIVFALCVFGIIFFGLFVGKADRVFRTSSLPLLFDFLWWSMLAGALMAFCRWIQNRNQKMKEKDDLNDLMRQYL